MLFHIYNCRTFRKSNQNRTPELGIPAEWQHSKVSRWNVTQTRKTSKAVKINQRLYSVFITFRNHRQKILMLFHIYKCRRFRKSNQKRAPELGIPAEWPLSEVSGQTSVKLEKLNEMGKWMKGNPLIMNFRNHGQKFFDVILLYICKYVKFLKSYKKK